MNYEDKKGSYIFGSPLQVNETKGIPYNYYPEFFYLPRDINLGNYLREDSIIDSIDRDQNFDRKYFDWKTINFCLRKNDQY